MIRFSILKALLKKETYQILKDPSTILISVVLPLLLLFLYGYGVSLDLDRLRIGLVVEDTSPDATGLIDSFRGTKYFDVDITRNRQDLNHKIVEGSIRGFVVIPSYFSEFLHNPEQIAPVQLIADGSETNTANFVQNYAQKTFEEWLNQVLNKSPSPIQVEPRVWYNEPLESRYFLLTGSLAITMTLIGTLLTALVISREWERGTMEAIFATPVTIVELLLGKSIPYFLLGFFSMALCTAVCVLFYQIPFEGSYWALALVSGCFLFCAMGLGLMISTLCRAQALAYQIAIVTGFLPAYILSGFLFEIYSMPFWIRCITYVIPARYFVQSLQTLFLVGNVWPLIVFNILPMLAIGVLFFLITVHKTVKRLD